MNSAVKSFNILLSRRLTIDAAFAGLIKRANRKGIPHAFSWTWGVPFREIKTVTLAAEEPPPPNAKRSPSRLSFGNKR